ncbi:MAG: T9SS type A sorting domain-containing protein [Bacteroidota bacterium]
MKILSTFLLFAALIAGNSAFAQANAYTVYDYPDSITGCMEQLYVQVSTGVSAETDGIITVTWGDGSSETENFTSTAGQSLGFSYQHGYSVAGNYIASVELYSTTSGSNVGVPQTVTLAANDPSNCGYIYINTFQNSPSMSYANAMYDFTDVNGVTTTVSQSANPNAFWGYSGLNVANAPYTVSLNDAWLTNNGLVQVSADITITGFTAGGMATPGQVSMEVDCAVAAADPDAAVSYSYAWAFVAPLQTGYVHTNICNYACNNTTDVVVSLTFPAGFTPNTAGLTNAVVNGNVLTFDVLGLTDCVYQLIPFSFPGNVLAGTELEFYLSISAPNDTELSNNQDTLYTVVLNSYDPNNKIVNKATNINANEDETLQYVINFQNEGNMAALDVVIRDTISANLDLSTFNVLGSKHGIATSVDVATRIVTFSFNQINLVPASQNEEDSKGYVVYSIRENTGLTVGTEIENTAYIYFDFNPAIITNTTYNINALLATSDLTTETISIYPNPATSDIRFNGATVVAARIFDMAGKLVVDAPSVINNELSVASLDNGMYHVVIETAQGVQTQKLVVRK